MIPKTIKMAKENDESMSINDRINQACLDIDDTIDCLEKAANLTMVQLYLGQYERLNRILDELEAKRLERVRYLLRSRDMRVTGLVNKKLNEY